MKEHKNKILLLLLTLCGISAAQTTTFTPAPGVKYTGVSYIVGWPYVGLVATAPDGTQITGGFNSGTGYYVNLGYTPAGQSNRAQYCNGTERWAQPEVLANGEILSVMDCDASADQTSEDPPVHIHVEIAAHSYQERVCFRSCRVITLWQVDSFVLTTKLYLPPPATS